ncbi:hypothetical protein QLQ97_13355 [Burkholderia pseudomallei]|uniref:hypothetical protein n=1 Tax=Burkholderia pseudomallei TaxID=28450 RepID=UPI0024A82CE0|nr:hypothetical protein [Burkholderia pseudomallei]MDI6018226.1 hypothetical protein [Burkholderia pseudomallei]
MTQQHRLLPDSPGEQIGEPANYARMSDASGATISPALDAQPEPCIGTCAEPHNMSDEVRSSERRDIEVIATAYDLHGRDPRRVVDFDHSSGRRVRRLLPECVFTSAARVRTALIKAGMSFGNCSSNPSAILDVAMTLPSMIGMYGIPYGWSRGQDAGPIYRFGNTAYSSSGRIPVYAEGPAPVGKRANDLDLPRGVLTADLSPCSAILVAAHLAGLLVPLLGCNPLVIVASGVSALDEAYINSLADSAFGTKAAAWHARSYANDGTLVMLATAKSRKLAFQQVRQLCDAATGAECRSGKVDSTPAPVTFVVTHEPDTSGNLGSPCPPNGCVEISFDGSQVAVAEGAAQSSSASDAPLDAVVAKTFINVVLRNPEPVIRNADKMMPKFFDRYLRMMKGDPSEEAVRITASAFAVLRYALTCGCQFEVIPWEAEAVDAVMNACVTCWSERHRDRKLAFERYVIDAVKKLADPGMAGQRAKPVHREVMFDTVKERELMLIEPRTFDMYIVAHFDKTRVLDVLRKRRLLVTNSDGAQYQKRIDGGRARFYAVDFAHLRTL